MKSNIIIFSVHLVVFLLGGINHHSNAQVSVLPRIQESSFSQLRDVFPVEVSGVLNINCHLVIEVANQDGIIVVGRSPVFVLKGDAMVFNGSYFNQFSWEYFQDEPSVFINKSGNFAPGDYVISWIVNTTEGLEIGRASINIKVIEYALKTQKRVSSNKSISFYGNGQLNVEYGSRPQMYSQYPNWGVVASFAPNLSIYEVPIYGSFLYSNISSRELQSPFIYSFGFDSEALKRVLVKRLQDGLLQNKGIQELTDLRKQTFTDIHNYDLILNHPEVQKELTEIKKLEKLQQTAYSLENLKQFDPASLNTEDLGQMKTLFPDSLSDYFDILKLCNEGVIVDSIECRTSKTAIERYKFSDEFLETFNHYSDSVQTKMKEYEHLIPKKVAYNDIIKQREFSLNKAKKNGWLDSTGLNASQLVDINKGEPVDFSDPEKLMSKLTEMGLLKKYEKYLMYLKSIRFGTILRKTGEFTLNNMPINGISIEVSPKNIYASFVYGQMLRPVQSPVLEFASYKRSYWSASVGYGLKDKNFVHFNMSQGKDIPSSIMPKDSLYLYYRKPGQNNVISLDFSWSFLKDRIKIFGELAGSQLIRDLTYNLGANIIGLDSNNLGNSKNWFVNIIRQRPVNLNTTIDYAYRIYGEIAVWKGKTSIVIGNERIGPNFNTFGNPFLLKDMFILNGQISQSLLKDKIRIKGGVKRYSDNQKNSGKALTTSQWRWLLDIDVRIPKLPSLKLTYMPIIQQNDSGFVNMNMVNSNVSYTTKVKDTRLQYSIGYIFQKGVISYSYGDFVAQTIMFSQLYAFGKSINIFNTNSVIFSVSNLGEILSFNLNAGIHIPIKDKAQLSIGGNCLFNSFESRFGANIGTSFSLSKYLNWNIQFEGFYYKTSRKEHIYYPRYDRLSLRSIWNINW